MRFRRIMQFATAVLSIPLLAAATPVQAQDYPNRRITLVVPYAPGGSSDLAARLVAGRLEKSLKQPIVVENRTGAGGYVGAETVTRAAPDGYTLLLGAGPTMHSNLFFKGQAALLSRDLTPIVGLAEAPFLVIAPAGIGVKTLKDFVAYARARPGALNLATIPAATSTLDAVVLLQLAGLKMAIIPYNATTAAVTSVAAEQTHLHFTTEVTARPMLQSGKVVSLAVGSAQRFPLTPDIPTLKEQGYDVISTAWYGLFGPGKLPDAIVAQLYKATMETMSTPDAVESLKKLGFAPYSATPEQLREVIASEVKTYAAAAKAAGIEPQ